jgi:hypothetical protein
VNACALKSVIDRFVKRFFTDIHGESQANRANHPDNSQKFTENAPSKSLILLGFFYLKKRLDSCYKNRYNGYIIRE